MSYRRPESALVVIYDDDSNVLLLQRNDDATFWQSVTGTLEPGETPMQAAYREVLEETGIDIKGLGQQLVDCKCTNQYEIRQAWRHRYSPETSINTEYVFSLKVTGNEPLVLTEHSAYEWLPKAEAAQKVWSESNRAAIMQFVPGDY